MTGTVDSTPDISSRARRWRDIPLSFSVIIVSIVVLFVSAGSPGWAWGWTLAGLMIINRIVSLFLVDPGLIRERTSIRGGYKGWDILLSTVMGRVGPFVIIIVSGLDYRFDWSNAFPLVLRVVGLVLLILAYLLVLWAMRKNRFFTSIVRIQKERGHHVINTGPYGIVRHPGYSGTIIHTIGLPLILGSYWALIPAFALIIISILRTVLEDNTLQQELEGYTAYAGKVRYRLIPGIW